MMKKVYFSILLLIVTLLTGCMYPEEKLIQNTIAYQDQIQSVQTSVEQFQKDNGGILPIKTFDESTPLYQRYMIDFKRLVPEYMAEPPGNAFESGGVFQYVIIDAETNPKVKLLDLRVADMVREIKIRIKVQGYPPFKDRLAENVFALDFKKLGYEQDPFITSPYTNKNLPFVIDGKGEVFVDYRSDLFEILNKVEHEYVSGEDIRGILLEESPIVPAYSLPYTIDDATKEPIFY